MIVKLAHADQLPPAGSMKSFVSAAGLELCVAVLQQGEETRLAAFHNRCPHQNAPLSAGHLDGCHVICPYHGWRFDAVTGEGEHTEDPGLTLYEIRRYGDEVFVRL